MRVIFVAFSVFLANIALAGTWEAPEISTESIRFVARGQKANYKTIMILRTDDQGVKVSLEARNGAQTILSGSMNHLQKLYATVRKYEPRVQDFVGLVNRHLLGR